MDTFDFVIVGAGSAGCVLARRLSESGKYTVCVLEAGPADRNPFIHMPAGFVKNVTNGKLTWQFVSQPVPGIGNRRIGLVQGKTLGGSSAINGMVYNRGQAADYDHWAQCGNPGWGHADVLPYFRRAETRIGMGDEGFRGREGPMTVSDPDFRHPLCDMFVAAAKSLSFPETQDYNGAAQDGVGAYQFSIDTTGRRPLRMSTARAYLHPARKTGRVDVRTNSHATRIVIQNGRAVGVRYRQGGVHGPETEVRARREVVLSAGALNTPRLLQLSGIGDPAHVRDLGVEVRAALPAVGRNLTDHYMLRVVAILKGIRTINERSRGLPLVWEVTKWLTGAGPSILGMGPVPMRVFVRSDPGLETPDLQMSFTPASYKEGRPGVLDDYPGMTFGGYMMRPQSRGWVRAVSADIAVAPEIQPNYLAEEADRRAIVAIVKTARRILQADSFKPHYSREVFPGDAVSGDAEILDFARQYGGTAYHHTSTARMGPAGDRNAVVDPQLRVFGIEGLRVADASVMPSITSGNTNAPTIMIAEKASDMVLAAAA